MPRRSYARKKNNRARYRKKRAFKRRYGKPTYMRASPLVFPDMAYTKLKFIENFNFSSPGQSRDYRGNGPFDPRVASGGQFPIAYLNWANIYNKVLCFGSKIRVMAINNTTTPGAANCQISLVPINSGYTGALTALEVACQPYSRTRYITVQNGAGPTILKSYMSTKKFFGIKGELDLTDYSSVTSTTPTNQFYWRVQCDPVDGLTNPDCWFQVQITYYLRFFERVPSYS